VLVITFSLKSIQLTVGDLIHVGALFHLLIGVYNKRISIMHFEIWEVFVVESTV